MLRALALCLVVAAGARAQAPQWISTGGPNSGYADDLVVAPDGRAFVTVGGTLYRSDDGRSWVRLGAPLHAARLAVSTEGVVFAWAHIFCLTSCTQGGVYRTEDGGETWHPLVMLGDDPLVYDIEAGADGRVFAATDAGLLRSDDGGETWSRIASIERTPRKVAANAAGYAAFYQPNYPDPPTLTYSSDNGETWATRPFPAGVPPHRLLVDGAGVLFAADYSYRPPSLYRSFDEGRTWEEVRVPADVCPVEVECDLGILETTAGTLSIGLVLPRPLVRTAVFASEDAGTTWEAMGALSAVGVTLAPVGGDLLAASTRAVFRYDHAAGTWMSSSTGISRSSVEVLAWSPDGALYTASVEGDVSRYDPATEFWTSLPYLARPRALAAAPERRVYAGVAFEPGPWVFEPGDENWTALGLQSVSALHRTARGTLLASAQSDASGVYRSTDEGTSWHFVEGPNAWVFAVDDITLYAGGFEGVFGSTDDGLSWTSLGLQDTLVYGLASADGVLWAVSPYDDAPGQGRIYRSTDGGESWDLVWEAPLNHQLRDIVAVPDGAVYVAAGQHGVYRSTDGGATWAPFDEGLPPHGVASLALGPDGHLYAGPSQSGVYRTTEPVLVAAAPPPPSSLTLRLRAPYPNPAARDAPIVLGFDLPAPARVLLAVYDLTGRAVAVLADGRYPAGAHAVSWRPASAAAGVYLCRLETDGQTETRKLVVLP